MNTHIVLKSLPVGGETLMPGTEVDASEWRTTPLLIEQRYLKPIESVVDGQSQPRVSFEEQVIAVVKKNLSENGELAQAFQGLSSLKSQRKYQTR